VSRKKERRSYEVREVREDEEVREVREVREDGSRQINCHLSSVSLFLCVQINFQILII
jgi:hypothetical protein